jgi:LCP family protein required for cell wall assembly
MNAYNLINILVLGSDRYSDQNSYRTDVIVIVSINQSSQTVSLLSIPRDLYVYIPGWGMERINAAELYQTQISTTRHPLGLLAETIEYNLGLRIDHLARVDFDRFEQLIDLLGGVDVPVDCAVSGFQPPSRAGRPLRWSRDFITWMERSRCGTSASGFPAATLIAIAASRLCSVLWVTAVGEKCIS